MPDENSSQGDDHLFHFPPLNAPESVKQAWEEATKGLSPEQMMTLTGSLLVVTLGNPNPNPYSDLQSPSDLANLMSLKRDATVLSSQYDMPWQVEHRRQQLAAFDHVLKTLKG